MKNVNELVRTVQAEGNESFAWVELFEVINAETIEPKSKSFSSQLKGDVDKGISEGYKLLMELTESWDGTGNFHTLFKTSFNNRLLNQVKEIGRNKRKHNTSYDVSLSESTKSEGEKSPILEVIGDPSLQTSFNIEESNKTKLETMFDKYAEKHPEQAGVIEIMLGFGWDAKQSDKTEAYCKYYGVDTYSSAIQKRVSRVRDSFYKFLDNNGYELQF